MLLRICREVAAKLKGKSISNLRLVVRKKMNADASLPVTLSCSTFTNPGEMRLDKAQDELADPTSAICDLQPPSCAELVAAGTVRNSVAQSVSDHLSPTVGEFFSAATQLGPRLASRPAPTACSYTRCSEHRPLSETDPV